MDFQTADLYDDHADKLSVASPLFMMIGHKTCFRGAIVTVKCHEDNSLVRETLANRGSDASGSSGYEGEFLSAHVDFSALCCCD